MEHSRRRIPERQAAGGVVAKIMHAKIPRHRRVFRGKGMKGGNLILVRKLRLAADGIAAGFEQQDPHSRFGKACRHRAATGSRADHDRAVVVGWRGVHCQNVLINSIKASLSWSLSGVSAPKAFSSSLNPLVSLNFAVPK